MSAINRAVPAGESNREGSKFSIRSIGPFNSTATKVNTVVTKRNATSTLIPRSRNLNRPSNNIPQVANNNKNHNGTDTPSNGIDVPVPNAVASSPSDTVISAALPTILTRSSAKIR